MLFDLDGVLTPTAEVHMRAWEHMFDAFFTARGVTPPYSDADYFAYVDGRPRYDGVRATLASRGVVLPEGEPTDTPQAERDHRQEGLCRARARRRHRYQPGETLRYCRWGARAGHQSTESRTLAASRGIGGAVDASRPDGRPASGRTRQSHAQSRSRQMNDQAFSLSQVSKTYKHFQLRGIDLELPKGCIMGFIGPNGAGKSTTIRILMGLIRHDAGEVSVLGRPMPALQSEIKRDLGFVSEDMRLYGSATIGWHMQWLSTIYPGWDAPYAAGLLSRFNLKAEQKVKGLSHGQAVKAALLLSLARHPRLLILDEPTTGLDPVVRHEVLRELVEVLKEEDRSVLMSSHNTQDVEQIADIITFINDGAILETSDKESFLERWRRVLFEAEPQKQTQPACRTTLHNAQWTHRRADYRRIQRRHRLVAGPIRDHSARSAAAHTRRDLPGAHCHERPATGQREGATMNGLMIKRLVLKDWYLHRLAIGLMTGGILLGMALAAVPGHTAALMGLNLILSLFIALTFYLPLSTVLNERTEKTLPFVMSLPVSPADYTMAKIISNVVLYLLPLLATALGVSLVFRGEGGGSLPIAIGHAHVVLLGMLTLFSFIVGFAIITESMGWTVALIVVTMFLFGNVVMQLVPRFPAAQQFLVDIANQGGAYFSALGVEALLILGILGLTFYVQANKRDFL